MTLLCACLWTFNSPTTLGIASRDSPLPPRPSLTRATPAQVETLASGALQGSHCCGSQTTLGCPNFRRPRPNVASCRRLRNRHAYSCSVRLSLAATGAYLEPTLDRMAATLSIAAAAANALAEGGREEGSRLRSPTGLAGAASAVVVAARPPRPAAVPLMPSRHGHPPRDYRSAILRAARCLRRPRVVRH